MTSNTKEYYLKNKEKIAAQKKEWKKRNKAWTKEYKKEYEKQYRFKNKERINKLARDCLLYTSPSPRDS